MKKPIIKNWIKYWTTTIAVSGMLALGACDSNNENNTADNVGTATEETVTSTRENVNQGMEDLEAETETEQLSSSDLAEQEAEASEVNQTRSDRTSDTNINTSADRSASSIRNMDAHLEEHEEANEAVKEELTDTDLSNRSSTGAAPAGQADRQESLNQPGNNMNEQDSESATELNNRNGSALDGESGTNPTQQQNSLDNQQQNGLNNQQESMETSEGYNTGPDQQAQDMAGGEQAEQPVTSLNNNENTSGLEEAEDPNTPAAIYERHIAVYPEGMSEYAQQRFNAVMSDYQERRESMRGQVNNETGAYIAADVDPQPTVSFEEVKNIIQRNIEYPETAAAARVEGIALVNLVVDENGNIEDAKANDEFIEANSSYPQSFTEEDIERAKEHLKEEAERAVKETSGLWEAAEQNGDKVKSEIQVPVRFILKDLGVGEYENLGTGQGDPTGVTE